MSFKSAIQVKLNERGALTSCPFLQAKRLRSYFEGVLQWGN